MKLCPITCIRRRVRFLELLVVVSFCLMMLIPFAFAERRCEVRVDCGDLRYTLLGWVTRQERMTEPTRTLLLKLAETSSTLRPEWVQIPYSENPEYRPHRMCQTFYERAARWADIDQEIAMVVAEDVADFIRQTHLKSGLPSCVCMLFNTDHLDGWREDPEVQAYLLRKGLN